MEKGFILFTVYVSGLHRENEGSGNVVESQNDIKHNKHNKHFASAVFMLCVLFFCYHLLVNKDL